jgi:hypothetical protein
LEIQLNQRKNVRCNCALWAKSGQAQLLTGWLMGWHSRSSSALGRRGLPCLSFGLAQWGCLPGWSPAGAVRQGKIPFWRPHAGHQWRPTDFGMPLARRGREDSTGTRWRGDLGLGLRGERGSPGDALHGGGDSRTGIDRLGTGLGEPSE